MRLARTAHYRFRFLIPQHWFTAVRSLLVPACCVVVAFHLPSRALRAGGWFTHWFAHYLCGFISRRATPPHDRLPPRLHLLPAAACRYHHAAPPPPPGSRACYLPHPRTLLTPPRATDSICHRSPLWFAVHQYHTTFTTCRYRSRATSCTLPLPPGSRHVRFGLVPPIPATVLTTATTTTAPPPPRTPPRSRVPVQFVSYLTTTPYTGSMPAVLFTWTPRAYAYGCCALLRLRFAVAHYTGARTGSATTRFCRCRAFACLPPLPPSAVLCTSATVLVRAYRRSLRHAPAAAAAFFFGWFAAHARAAAAARAFVSLCGSRSLPSCVRAAAAFAVCRLPCRAPARARAPHHLCNSACRRARAHTALLYARVFGAARVPSWFGSWRFVVTLHPVPAG